MQEEFLHYIWKHKLFDNKRLTTHQNEKVEIIKPGDHNQNSGPDFLNAKIRIGSTLWAGNVEIHIRSSDWQKHGHQNDKAYDNVILQVVLENDSKIVRTNGLEIPTVKILYNEKLYKNYSRLLSGEKWIPCQSEINTSENFRIKYWLNSIVVERLEHKSDKIQQTLKQYNNNWEETFYIHLARNLGFQLNADPFEMLAKSLPLKYLSRHRDNIFQLEALLFGQAGFLEKSSNSGYFLTLKKEYQFLQKKYQLEPLEKHLWKFLRLRPANFPTVRIAQLASMIFYNQNLFSNFLESENIEQIYRLFSFKTAEFWDTHYTFNKPSAKRKKMLGKSAINLIIINTLVPFLFIFGKNTGKENIQDRALEWLYRLPAENNTIIRNWSQIGFIAKNAADSQALLHLKNQYCIHKKCLNCEIGNQIISKQL